jgi:hypothetical protein
VTEKKADRIESSPRKPSDFTPLALSIHCFVRNPAPPISKMAARIACSSVNILAPPQAVDGIT